MFSGECRLSKDTDGCDMILVSKEELADFPVLIQSLREKGYGAPTGVLKLRLKTSDRDDVRVMEELLVVLKRKFKEKGNVISKKTSFAFNPQVQYFFKASVSDDIYQYSADFCTASERRTFIKEATATSDMGISDCCKMALEEGVHTMHRHCFDVIRKDATFTAELLEKEGSQHEQVNAVGSPLIYGAGVNMDTPIKIAGNFSLSNLNSIIDYLDVKHDGIATPYAYCGAAHTCFPWHIEDGGLFSINYVISGAPKLWFVIPPECFGVVDSIAHTFNLPRGHTSCRALLVDHKVLVADPKYFNDNFGIPYSTVVQEPGDFIITFPFALHSGMNLGKNWALASNFGDESWIEEGMYAPVCACNPHQVSLDLSPILRECKPQLLQSYNKGTGSLFPPTHPREIRRYLNTQKPPSVLEDGTSTIKTPLSATSSQTSKGGLKHRTLNCPKCDAVYNENKMGRLEEHVNKKHSEESLNILRIIKKKYPPWQPKTHHGFACKVCGKFRRGSIAQLKHHHSIYHGEVPFNGGIKSDQ